LTRAEEIVRSAKKIMKKRNLQKARDRRKRYLEWMKMLKEQTGNINI